jgi:3-hydroxybutyryl-CoA dehydrogenase
MGTKDIHKAAVIGSGTMGSGIAQVFALAGLDVTLVDLEEKQLERARGAIEKNLARQVEKGKLEAGDKDTALSRITTTTEYAAISGADLVVEAVSENKEVKRKVITLVEEQVGGDCIIASNTSTISLSQIAGFAALPKRVIGMHFMNPVPVMKLVEVITALQTDDAVKNTVAAVTERIGKTPVVVKDSPGFVLNRVLIPMINEAVYIYEGGVAGRDEIDACMKLGAGQPMGPLELADLIGIDICLHIMEVLYEDFGDSKYRPCPMLHRMVAAGRLGRKSGAGFYDYDK